MHMLVEFPVRQLGDMSYSLIPYRVYKVQDTCYCYPELHGPWLEVPIDRDYSSTMLVMLYYHAWLFASITGLQILIASQIHPGHWLVVNVHDVKVSTSTVKPGQCGRFDKEINYIYTRFANKIYVGPAYRIELVFTVYL